MYKLRAISTWHPSTKALQPWDNASRLSATISPENPCYEADV